jgi:hypothetical protein
MAVGDITYGSEYQYSSSVQTFIEKTKTIVWMDDTHFVSFFRDGNNSSGASAIAGEVSNGNEISFGSQILVGAAPSGYTFYHKIEKIDSTRFICVWYYNGNSTFYARIGTLSGTSISLGSTYTISNNSTAYCDVCLIDTDKVLITYIDSGGKCRVANISGTSISFGSVKSVDSSSTNYVKAVKLDTNKAAVIYSDSGSSSWGKAKVATISGTSVSLSSESTFNQASTLYIDAAPLNTDKFIVVYSDYGNSNYGTAIVGTASGTSISYGSEHVFLSKDLTTISMATSKLGTDKAIITYYDSSEPSGNSKVATISGTSISYGSEFEFSSGAANFQSVSAKNETDFIASYVISGKGRVIIGQIESDLYEVEYTGAGTVSVSGSASTETFGNYGTYTGSGTATLSGSAYSEISLDKEYMPSGGATLSGLPSIYIEIYDYTGSGSMTLSGDATEIEENDFIGSGSILLSGEATAIVYSLGYIYTASGSGQFSGTAPVGEAVDIVYKGDPPSSFHPSRDIIVVEENSAVSSFDIDSYGDKFIHVYESVDGAYMEAQKLVPSTDDVWGETYLRRVGGSISISNTQEHAVTIINDTTAVVAHASSSGNIDTPLVQRMQIISMGGSHGVTLSTNPLVIYDNHDSRLPKLTRLDDTRFLLTYWSWGSNDSFYRLIAKVCYISGTSINVYNPYVISDEAQQHGNGPECYDVKLIDTDKVVVSYRNSSTSRGALRVCSISFASVTVGDEYEMGTGTAFSISLTKIASNEFGVMSNTGWDGFRRCQVSGTSITFGPLITDDEVKPTYNGDINYQFGKLSTFFMDSSNRGIGQSMRLVGDELKDKWIHEVLSENIEDPRIQPLDNGVLVAYYIDNADNSYLKSAIIQTRGVSEIYPGLIASGSAQPQISKDFSGSGSISLTGEAESEVLRIYEGLGNISLSGRFNFTIDVHPVVGGTISIYGLALVEKESVYNPSGNISLSGVVATEKDSYYIGGGTTVLSSQYSAQVDIIEDGFVIGFFDGSADTYPELTPIGSGEIRISGLADYTIDKVFIPSGRIQAYGAVATVSPGGAAYTGYGKVKAIGSVGLDELHVAELGSGYVNLYGSSVATMNNEYIMLGGMSITGQSLDEVDRSVYVYGQATIYGGLIDSEVGAFYNASGSIQLQGHSPEFIEIYSYSGSGVVQASGVANIEFYTYWPTGGITLSGSFIVDATYDSMEVVVRESYINRNIYVESSIVKDITVESITDRKFTIRSLL